jgi:hypothetical protein
MNRNTGAVKTTAGALILLLFSCSVFSCTSLNVRSKGYLAEGESLPRDASFVLGDIKVISYNFLEKEEIGYIMAQKLSFSLAGSRKLRFHLSHQPGDYILDPELIIKVYEERYATRNYYLLTVRVMQEERVIGHFTYEYNGSSSVFDAQVQNSMVKSFVDDLSKSQKK